MKKIIRALRNCHLFRPMTLEEAKALCLALSESIVRKHEVARKVAHPFRLRLYAVKTRLEKGSLLLHIRFLVGSKKERTDIILGCFDAHVERMLKPARGDRPPTDAASEIEGSRWVSAHEPPGNDSWASARSFRMAVIPLLPAIINHFGKIVLGAAVTTLGGLAYAQRERISRWLDNDGLDATPPTHDSTRVLETIESLKDKKHAELLDKLTAMNTKTMGDFRVLINEAQSEVITSMAELEGQLDAQRSETRALGEELREAVAHLARRQDAVEQFLHGKDKGEVFAVPGRQRTAAETPRRQEEKGKKLSPNGSKRKGNGSTAPETRAP